MLPCVCSVIDHNVVRRKKCTRGDSRVCLSCSYHILTSSVIYYWTDARQHGIYLFYIIMKQTTTDKAFYFQNIPRFNITRKKPSFAHFGEHEWKLFDVIYYLYKIKQTHWFLCVAKNCDWSRKITPLPNLTRASLLVEWKLTAKAWELNCKTYRKILKKMLVKSTQFLSSEQPCKLKSLKVALNIAGVEKIPSENLLLRST